MDKNTSRKGERWQSKSLFLIFFLLLQACQVAQPEAASPLPLPTQSITVPTEKRSTPTATLPILSSSPTSQNVEIDFFQHTVQTGETLFDIAEKYGLNPTWIAEENQLSDPTQLYVGMVLDIPVPPQGSDLIILPDSALVYGDTCASLDLHSFFAEKGGYLLTYHETVEGQRLSAAEIIELVAYRYSVSPRVLIALIEYQSGWLYNATPYGDEKLYPLGYRQWGNDGLYKQLTWAANQLNRGYYAWGTNNAQKWTLADHSMVAADPAINAGTAALQYFFSQLDTREIWYANLSENGFLATYAALFGEPAPAQETTLSLSPHPTFQLPFSYGETWYFTGGAHEGWDTGSPWAAIDFAPPAPPQGCSPRDEWVLALADGIVAYADLGWVLIDLDGDGNPGTGWVVVYTHVANRDQVPVGTQLRAGERIGHPSCEGGVASAAHIHIARRFNGEWISAAGETPFVLDDWVLVGSDQQYGGYLMRDGVKVEAWSSYGEVNQIQR